MLSTLSRFQRSLTPEKYISHKSAEQYFLKQYFCISSIKHLEKGQSFKHSAFTPFPSAFGHRVTPLAIVWNLADSWLHFHQLEICPPGNTKSIINRIGLCLVMKTMILTMVYLSWWAGSVQWRLQSLYDEVKIRRHVDKIYYLCLLKLFYFFSRKVYFSQIWLAIFLGKIFLYFINILPPCDTTCNWWK